MFDLQGHRGARGLFPENTLEGFVAAMAIGVDSFEIDIAVTRDGVPVLNHDPALNPAIVRQRDGAWLAERGPLIRSLTLAELEVFDVGRLQPGTSYARTYASQVPHDGARIPTLAAVLALPARFNIELKLLPDHPEWTIAAEEMVERVLAVVERAEAVGRVTIQSFDWRAPRHVRRIRPDVRRGWLTEAKTVAAAALWRGDPGASPEMAAVPAAIEAEGGGTWTPYYSDLTPALLAEARRLGLLVIPWTVNETADMQRLIDWGVDGLISDWPDRALALVGRRMAATPPGGAGG